MKNKFKKGAIVVVIKGILLGNDPGTITKILSEPGALNDRALELTGKNKWESKNLQLRVMCKNMTDFDTSIKYCNEPAYTEAISDLRLATKEEKKWYKKDLKLRRKHNFIARKRFLDQDEKEVADGDYLNFSSPQLEF